MQEDHRPPAATPVQVVETHPAQDDLLVLGQHHLGDDPGSGERSREALAIFLLLRRRRFHQHNPFPIPLEARRIVE
ncbi:hypothetical protein D3C83_107900 [compost metagenome]